MSIIIAGVVKNGVVVPNAPLPEGAQVEIHVNEAPEKREPPRMSMLEFLATLPPGPLAFPTWEEYEKHLREEKNAWER